MADATSLTQAGYVGDDVESLLHKLLVAADFDPDRAAQGILFIDEIDKALITYHVAGRRCALPREGGS